MTFLRTIASTAAMTGLTVAVLGLQVQSRTGAMKPAAAVSRTSTVTTFNDGFTDAKRDDCQQGFRPACAWLRTTGRAPLPRWFHAVTAPRRVSRSACSTWPQYGLGKDKRGQVVPGVEVWAPHTDGAVYCQSGHVAMP